MLHLLSLIRLFGPARQSACFRFEGLHAYFKSLVTIIKNFKNIAFSMIYRHQARMCLQLCTFSEMSHKKFLKLDDCITPGPLIKITDLTNFNLFHCFFSNDELLIAKAMQVPKIITCGTEYRSGSIILLKCNEDILPIFGEVSDIYILENGT